MKQNFPTYFTEIFCLFKKRFFVFEVMLQIKHQLCSWHIRIFYVDTYFSSWSSKNEFIFFLLFFNFVLWAIDYDYAKSGFLFRKLMSLRITIWFRSTIVCIVKSYIYLTVFYGCRTKLNNPKITHFIFQSNKINTYCQMLWKTTKMNFFPIKSWVSISLLRIWISDAHQLEIFLTFWENAVKVEWPKSQKRLKNCDWIAFTKYFFVLSDFISFLTQISIFPHFPQLPRN